MGRRIDGRENGGVSLGWIHSSSPESTFWNGRLTIGYVIHVSPESAATRMLVTCCENEGEAVRAHLLAPVFYPARRKTFIVAVI
jgi:hypothetical protein